MGDQHPAEGLLRYLEGLFGRDREGFVEIAHRERRGDRSGPMRRGAKGGKFIPTSQPGRVADEIERLARSGDVWVGVLPRRPDPQTGEIGGSKEFVSDARVLWVDADLKEAPDAEERLRRFGPRPHMVVRSGGGFHAYWLLDEPLARDWIPFANRRLAHALGADFGATDAARILRPPGTRNWKYDPPRPVELVDFRVDSPHRVRELVGSLADPPGRRNRPRRSFRPGPHIAADPLRAIPPPVYVRELSGAEVPDAGGIVRCPLPDHEDPDPSCQVFPDAERGWYCYGCQRGGSIFDFAAHLVGLQTSGRDFLALRRELERRFHVGGPGPPSGERGARAPTPRGGAAAVSPRRTGDTGRPGGSAPSALLERPARVVQSPAARQLAGASPLPGRADPPATEVAELLPAGEEVEQERGAELPLPVTVPALKALLVVGGALLGGMGLFVLVFTLIPLSRPASGELVCGVSGEARGEIPGGYLHLYRVVGRSFGLDWALLAAIGSVESDHGRNMGPSSAGALGPMQFMPGTWAAYGVDGDGDGRRDIMDPSDAIPGAARYLKASGAPRDWRSALFTYNHATWYVEEVLHEAERYRAACRELAVPFSPGSGPLGWPVHGAVVGRFGDPRPGHRHAGIDIAAPIGTPVHAAERGRVALRGPFQGYGNYLCVQHLPRLTTCYGHLSEYRAPLGEVVQRGDVVALVGCTGRCFGPHLHFEVRLGPPWSRPVDPLRYLESGK